MTAFSGLVPPTDSPLVVGASQKSQTPATGSSTGKGAAKDEKPPSTQASQSAPPKYAHQLVRTDATMGNLRSFLYTQEADGGEGSSAGKATPASQASDLASVSTGKRTTASLLGESTEKMQLSQSGKL